jgi:drug/metabolite transporter (DMT)-like permease
LLLAEGVFALGIGLSVYGEIPQAMSLIGAAIILGCAGAISLIDYRK